MEKRRKKKKKEKKKKKKKKKKDDDDEEQYQCISDFTIPRGPETKTKLVSTSKYGGSDRRAVAVADSNEFVVVGNEGGEVIVYNGATGRQVRKRIFIFKLLKNHTSL